MRRMSVDDDGGGLAICDMPAMMIVKLLIENNDLFNHLLNGLTIYGLWLSAMQYRQQPNTVSPEYAVMPGV